MSTAVVDETPTETITTVAAPEASAPESVTATASGTGPFTGAEFEIAGSYRKLVRGLRPSRLTRKHHLESGAALAQAIHRSKPFEDADGAETATDSAVQRPAGHRAKTIARYTAEGLKVTIDDTRYDISLRKAGSKTVMTIGNLAH